MPTVPRAEREVAIGGLPGTNLTELSPNAPGEAFGGGAAGRAMTDSSARLAEGIGGIQDKMRQRANEAAIEGIDLELSQEQTRIEIEAKKMKGRDAAGSIDYADSEWGKVGERVRKKAANGQQQAALAKLMNARAATLNRTTQLHSASELEIYDKAQSEVYVAQIGAEAVQNKDDPKRVQEALALQAFAVERQGKKNGLDEGMIKHQQQKVLSATKYSILSSMLDTQDPLKASKAKAYYESIESTLTPDDKAKAYGLVKKTTLDGEAQIKADAIFGGARTQESAYGELSKITDVGLRDETTKRLDALFTRKNRVEKEREESNQKFAANIIDQYASTDRIPRSMWNSFTPAQRSQLDTYAKHQRDGTEPTTDWKSYYNLKTMSASPELRSEFMRINLMQYRNSMANTEFKELVNAQDGLRKGDDKTAKMLDGVRTDQEIINTALKKAGIDPNSNKESEAESYGLFRSKVDEKAIAWKTAHSKPDIPGPELQKIVDDLMIEGVTEKRWFWFDKSKRKFELQKGEYFKQDAVPDAERKIIEEKLRKRGITPSDEKILEVYSRGAGQ